MTGGFRDSFKYYKRKEIPPDLSNVVNFNSEKYSQDEDLVKKIVLNGNINSVFGMSPPTEWKVYEFISKPGLIFIKNPFNGLGQRYWIIRCLESYTRKPSKLNIDAHNIIKTNEDWWEYCQRESQTEEGANALEKLRWATFGYHHNWDTKEYSEDFKCNFPTDLNFLCKYIAEILKFSDFNAEAAIVNLYHFGSSLSGHTDHSEVNVQAPLFSFSFGQSAIFLIGGKFLEDEALPILLESGDIVIMSGESRLSYHGVPRILPARTKHWNKIEEENINCDSKYFLKEVIGKLCNAKLWTPFDNYVNKSRINMNVRQVLLPGQNSLNS